MRNYSFFIILLFIGFRFYKWSKEKQFPFDQLFVLEG
jgi:hypothetical protein